MFTKTISVHVGELFSCINIYNIIVILPVLHNLQIPGLQVRYQLLLEEPKIFVHHVGLVGVVLHYRYFYF